jgi:hypothetical protein
MPCVEEGCELAQAHAQLPWQPDSLAGAPAVPAAAAAARGACPVCLEPLAAAPCLLLRCGARHAVHAECAAGRLKAGAPGPDLSFGFLFCPICGPASSGRQLSVATAPPHLDHPSLAAALEPHLQMRCARRRSPREGAGIVNARRPQGLAGAAPTARGARLLQRGGALAAPWPLKPRAASPSRPLPQVCRRGAGPAAAEGRGPHTQCAGAAGVGPWPQCLGFFPVAPELQAIQPIGFEWGRIIDWS